VHYLSPEASPASFDTLVIFLHGFPDSCYVWRRQLHYPIGARVKLIAIDLPGCGGSDNLPGYGPDAVLNTVSEAIVQLKLRYLGTGSGKKPAATRCVLVSHDWGGAIAFRIAAETTGLFDAMIVANSIYPLGARNQVVHHLERSRHFFDAGRLGDALPHLRAVLAQVFKSSYIFLVALPLPLARWMPWLALALVKLCHGLAAQFLPQATPDDVAVNMALSCGPSKAECFSKTPEGVGYGSSVLLRAQTTLHGDWDERVRLYREGLGLDKWVPNYTNLESRRDEQTGKFCCPVDIVFGLKDVALDPRIVLENIEQYFPDHDFDPTVQTSENKHITKLPNSGHWSILEDEGAVALERVLQRIVDRS